MEDKNKKIDAFTKQLINKELVIEGGFAGYLLYVYNGKTVPTEQYNELKNAFFAGAHHLFTSVMSTLDKGEDATVDDMKRVTGIHNELEKFIKDFELKFCKTQGNG